MKKTCPGFLTRSNTNQAVQPQMIAGGLKFGMKEVEGLYCLCRENKAAGQLRAYHAADLHLYFCIHKKRFSHEVAHFCFREQQDSVFECASMAINLALWYTKHAAKLAAKEE